MDNIELEIQEQARYKMTYFAKHGAILLCTAVLAFNGLAFVFLLFTAMQAAYHFAVWPGIAEKLDERLKMVACKQQIKNIYVFSLTPDDTTGAATAEKILKRLKESGNKHEVRVWLALYQDACVFWNYYDTNGVLRSGKEWRDVGSTYETWVQYVAFCIKFQNEKNDLRLRELRENKAGYQWVNQHVLNQISQL